MKKSNFIVYLCAMVCMFYAVSVVSNAAPNSKTMMFPTAYETNQNNVMVWPSEKALSVPSEIIEKEGTIVMVVEFSRIGNCNWARLQNGGYIMASYVREHEHNCYYQWSEKIDCDFSELSQKKMAKEHRVYYIECSTCSCGQVEISEKKYYTEKHHFVEDRCSDCGYYRKIVFTETLPFVSVKNGVPVRNQATSKVDTLYTLDKNEKVEIAARYRSENGNLWFVDCNGNFIYYENLALDMDELLERSKDYVNSCPETMTGILKLSLVANKVLSDWDYKQQLGHDIDYNVQIGHSTESMTGEDIGNYTYGYIGAYLGFSDWTLVTIGGMDNVMDGELAYCDLRTMCETPNDAKMIKKGVKYYKNSK